MPSKYPPHYYQTTNSLNSWYKEGWIHVYILFTKNSDPASKWNSSNWDSLWRSWVSEPAFCVLLLYNFFVVWFLVFSMGLVLCQSVSCFILKVSVSGHCILFCVTPSRQAWLLPAVLALCVSCLCYCLLYLSPVFPVLSVTSYPHSALCLVSSPVSSPPSFVLFLTFACNKAVDFWV